MQTMRRLSLVLVMMTVALIIGSSVAVAAVKFWTCPASADTSPSRNVLFSQSNLLELGGAQIA